MAEDYCLLQNAHKKAENNTKKEEAALRCYLHEPLVFCNLHVSENKKQKQKQNKGFVALSSLTG